MIIKNLIVFFILISAMFSTNIIGIILAYLHSYNSFADFKNVSTMNKIEIYINALEIILSFLSNRALLFSILVLVVWFINEKGLRLNLDKQ